MNKKIIMSFAVAGLLSVGHVFADEGHEHKMSNGTMMKGEMHQEAVEVGNKICPVSGQKVGSMGEIVKHEYNGKVYNLCCGMCPKSFQKDPEKYSKIAEDEVAASKSE